MVSSIVFSSTPQSTLAKEKVQQAEVWGFFTLKNVNFINLLFFFKDCNTSLHLLYRIYLGFFS